MLGLFLFVTLIFLTVKMAEMENMSTFLWGTVAVVVGFACMAIPLPYLNMVIAAVIMFALLALSKALSNQKG